MIREMHRTYSVSQLLVSTLYSEIYGVVNTSDMPGKWQILHTTSNMKKVSEALTSIAKMVIVVYMQRLTTI